MTPANASIHRGRSCLKSKHSPVGRGEGEGHVMGWRSGLISGLKLTHYRIPLLTHSAREKYISQTATPHTTHTLGISCNKWV